MQQKNILKKMQQKLNKGIEKYFTIYNNIIKGDNK